MNIHLLIDKETERVVMYDKDTNMSFGPVMDNEFEASLFYEYIKNDTKQLFRTFINGYLQRLYIKFKNEKEV